MSMVKKEVLDMSNWTVINGHLQHSDDELMHYGVLGMKWGIRRAKKKGVSYTYKSHGQKKYEKKLVKQQSKGADASALNKTKQKLDLYKKRDANRQDYAERTSVGKSVLKGLLMGPIGAGSYNRLRASGKSRIGAALVSNILVSTAGMPIQALATRHAEFKAARKRG